MDISSARVRVQECFSIQFQAADHQHNTLSDAHHTHPDTGPTPVPVTSKFHHPRFSAPQALDTTDMSHTGSFRGSVILRSLLQLITTSIQPETIWWTALYTSQTSQFPYPISSLFHRHLFRNLFIRHGMWIPVICLLYSGKYCLSEIWGTQLMILWRRLFVSILVPIL